MKELYSAASFAVRQVVFLTPFCVVFQLVCLKIARRRFYWSLVREDALFEDLTFYAYLFSSPLAVVVAVVLASRRQWTLAALYGVLALGLLFVAGEEISWGQRVWELETPELLTRNRQNELNLHNLASRRVLHGAYILVAGIGAFGRLLLPRPLRRRLGANVDLLLPRWYLTSYFFPAAALYVYFDYLSPILLRWLGESYYWTRTWYKRFMIARDQEPAEALLAAGFALFVCDVLLRLWLARNRRSVGAEDPGSRGEALRRSP
ncbi:MAG: hypothetical protein OES32_08900 [Acidobacteriota bacterium]|nr:hypothetical protein [Acidobacteriota bacterium]MDH3523690.1 hypothetical protein [Acidobacteriota bacterium]